MKTSSNNYFIVVSTQIACSATAEYTFAFALKISSPENLPKETLEEIKDKPVEAKLQLRSGLIMSKKP